MTEEQRVAAAASLQEVLTRSGVTKVIIIDDAYDPPILGELDPDAPTAFIAAIEDDEACRRRLAEIGVDLAGELTDEHIRILYNASGELGPLEVPWENLAGGHVRSKRVEVEALREILEKELGLEVLRSGPEKATEAQPGVAPIAFVDYVMGGGPDGSQRAKALVDQLLDVHDKAECPRPFILLMSNRNLSQAQVEEFRQSTTVLGGMYDFRPKDALIRPEGLFLWLAGVVTSIPNGQKLQKFVDVLGRTLSESHKDFMRIVRGLSLEDYAYIQLLSLQRDGQPLGDYLVWLLSTVLGDLVFGHGDMAALQRDIDAIRFSTVPPAQSGPSSTLADMYHRAQFVEVEDVAPHPRDPDERREHPYVHLGDLFLAPDQEHVWALLTAECDLAFAPDASRPFPERRAAKLIPGKLVALREPHRASDRTGITSEIFCHEDRRYRINWDPKGVVSFPLAKLRTWLDENALARKYRLRMPFALKLQLAYASDLTRVGMPVPPPFPQPMRAQLFGKGTNGEFLELSDLVDGEVFKLVAGEAVHCIITDQFLQRLGPAVERAVQEIESSIEQLDPRAVAPARARIEEIRSKVADVKQLLDIRDVHPLPKAGKSDTIVRGLLCISHGGSTRDRYTCQEPIALWVAEIPEPGTQPLDRHSAGESPIERQSEENR